MSEVRVQRSAGIASHSCCSTTTGSSPSAMPMRLDDAQHVAVDRQAGNAERVAEDDVRRLAPDAGQLDERLHRVRHLAAVLVDERLRHAEQRLRFGAEETGGMNLRLELGGRGLRQRARVGYRLNSAGVTMLTRASVDCAERIVATSSSNGVV